MQIAQCPHQRYHTRMMTSPARWILTGLLAASLTACTFQVSVEPPESQANATPRTVVLDDLVGTAIAATLAANPDATDEDIPNRFNLIDLEATLAAEPGLIYGFELTPDRVEPGGEITLTWSFQGDQGRICQRTTVGTIEWCENVINNGVRTITVEPNARNSLSFVLQVFDNASTEEAIRTVSLTCPDEWFFAGGPAECPAAPAIRTYAVAQPFEDGLMILLLDQIYILFDSGVQTSGQAIAVADPYEARELEVELTPPDGLHAPELGFAALWRGTLDPDLYGPISGSISTRLGWATAPVSGYTTFYQCDSTAIEEFRACYLLAPDGRVITITLGFWQYWPGSG